MKKIKDWYSDEGFFQFLLGNMWNTPDMRITGRVTLVFVWGILMIGFVPFFASTIGLLK